MELIKKGKGIYPYTNACDPLCDGQCSCKSKSPGQGCIAIYLGNKK